MAFGQQFAFCMDHLMELQQAYSMGSSYSIQLLFSREKGQKDKSKKLRKTMLTAYPDRNNRKMCVGKDLWRSSIPNPAQHRAKLEVRRRHSLEKVAVYSRVSHTSKDGDSSAALGTCSSTDPPTL